MNITYSLILCATIKECADNYTLEQWASRVDFNASPITKMLLPISPLWVLKVLGAQAQENRRIPGVRALPFGFEFRTAPLFCASRVVRVRCSALRHGHSITPPVLFVIGFLFLYVRVSEKYYRHVEGENCRHVFFMCWYLRRCTSFSGNHWWTAMKRVRYLIWTWNWMFSWCTQILCDVYCCFIYIWLFIDRKS